MSKRVLSPLIVLAGLLATGGEPARAVEQKKIVDVWPVGMRQQYLYYTNGGFAGEQWMEVREIPRTRGRYEIVNTIDVDGVPFGSTMKLTGESVAELDPWGRPVAYELAIVRPQGPLEMSVTLNYPNADIVVNDAGEERTARPFFNDQSRFIDLAFIGPFDLAYRLQPVNPQAKSIHRTYFVPQLEVNIETEFPVMYEETLTTPDGDEVQAVRVSMRAVLLDVWIGPGGRLVKAEVPSEGIEIWPGKTELP